MPCQFRLFRRVPFLSCVTEEDPLPLMFVSLFIHAANGRCPFRRSGVNVLVFLAYTWFGKSNIVASA